MVAVVDDAVVAFRWRAGGRTQPRLRGWSHLCAVPVAVAASVALLRLAPDPTALFAAAVYGASLCALFTVSALYHRVRWYAIAHLKMRRLDHGTIYLMIAGTYTPLLLLPLDGPWSACLLVIVWLVAATGFGVSVSGIADHASTLKNACYAGLGSIGLVVLPQLAGGLEAWQLLVLAAAGGLYGVGALCLATGRPDPFPATFGYHEIWHALIIVACACQYVVVGSLIRAG